MHRTRSYLWLLWLLAASGSAFADESPEFQKDIRPLLDAKCVRCHGDKVKKADLDLSTPAGVLKGGESGPAVVPGKPEKSLLYEQVHKGAMPPAKKDALAAAEVETLRRWIADGAKVPAGSAEVALTQHDVIPILLRHCTACHGRHKQEANLDLRTPAADAPRREVRPRGRARQAARQPARQTDRGRSDAAADASSSKRA